MNITKSIVKKQKERIILFTCAGFIINSFYGISNGIFGILTNSWWLITLSAYYIIISIMRISVILYRYKNGDNNIENGNFIKRFSGYMFFVLGIIIIGTTLLAVKENTGTKYHEIIMISVATYTFSKTVLAFVNLCKSKKYCSPIITTIRNISFADAAVSIFSLQRSMLASFGNMAYSNIRIFNMLTGAGVFLLIMFLGINLTRKENKNGKI